MADPDPKPEGEPIAPIPKDAIDPELVKLGRKRPTVGIVTAAGLVFLCAFFLVRLLPDKRFSGNDAPVHATVADVVAGKLADNTLVTVAAEPLVSHAIRTMQAKGNLGLRAVPARSSGEKLWLVVSGDGFDAPSVTGYTGRLRTLADMPFADALRDYAHDHPRPEFVTAEVARRGGAQVKTIGGETIAVAPGDKVAYDIVDTASATIVASFEDRLPDQAAWHTAIAGAGIAPASETADKDAREVRFAIDKVPDAVATVTKQLEAAKLYATRVDPVTRHVETTWGQLAATLPADADLVGVYVDRDLPADARVLVTGENPEDYWYILPIMIGLAVIGLVFLWALVRAVRRDLLS